jgi:hypothetical protein
VPEVYGSEDAWRRAIAGSDVRLQWDPDHDPGGRPVERRAIQLGLRGEALAQYAKEWLLDVQDISAFVREQMANAQAPYDRLVTPREEVYPVADPQVGTRLGITRYGDCD